MKLIFDVIAFIASVMTIIAFIGLFLGEEKFQYFIIIAVSFLAAIDAIALSRISLLADRLNKLERR